MLSTKSHLLRYIYNSSEMLTRLRDDRVGMQRPLVLHSAGMQRLLLCILAW